ncbi:MAG: alpha-amylase/4-alpha-glucanotransferase domain-containing protein, partial [Candidatus Saccharicenans sp.]
IPIKDRLAQINLMTDFLQENFKIKPKGLWLAERVWEPHLASLLSQAGLEYTLLDEEHFRYAGVKNIYGYYVTEDEGLKFNVFPIDKTLRYYIPFRQISELQNYFQRIVESGNDTAIIGDDGEKFGLWPGTNKWVYQDGWLKNFLEFIRSSEIEMITFSQYLERRPPLARVYLPPASYEEMMEWALGPEDQKEFIQIKNSLPERARRFLRGGQFRDFSLRYPESHHLRCRQLQVSAEVSQSSDQEARKDLYQAQCNDAYWHGVFGGLYLPHLRRAVYQKLISAELKIPFLGGWEEFDFDLDGQNEFILKTPSFFLWIKPSAGGGITEIDDRFHGFNLTDTLTRRQEFYHLYSLSISQDSEGKSIHELPRQLPAEAQKMLVFDNYRRLSFLERFLPPLMSREEYENFYYQVPGNFIEKPFSARTEEESLILERQAEVDLGAQQVKIRLRKRIRPGLNSLLFVYEIENLETWDLNLTFTSEWNLAVFENEYELSSNRVTWLQGQLSLQAPEVETIWDFPVRTISQSEKDFEIITQSISFHPVWRLKLAAGGKKVLLVILQSR